MACECKPRPRPGSRRKGGRRDQRSFIPEPQTELIDIALRAASFVRAV
ncbi:hypothetical protein FTUN_8390 [Frigoriglobus tundricola]|uniref:Uncharacterized protein n=1 Tax=Frigoriglobus tundricola TaxID=2774151 RepID=A0A6M5Z2V9_9BACT|nr:hypothetical protein FTUN_8390 [Frigoriglobus tundricola]